MPFLCCCESKRLDRSAPDPEQQSTKDSIRPAARVESHEQVLVTPAVDPAPQLPEASFETTGVVVANPAQLDSLFTSESDGNHVQRHRGRRASAAFDVVRQRLSHRFSDASTSKRQSTVSVGNSQEEIARRAELRRLHHKRIQDELLDSDKKDDASQCSLSSAQRPSPVDDSCQVGGPRDTIEFVVMDKNQAPTASPSPSHSLRTPKVPKTRSTTASARSSLATQATIDIGGPSTKEMAPLPLTALTTSEDEDPQAAPGEVTEKSDTRSSLRLSSTPSWLDRVIEADQRSTNKCGKGSHVSQSALGVWLLTQGLRSRGEFLDLPGSSGSQNVSPGSIDIQDIDGAADTDRTVPEHEEDLGENSAQTRGSKSADISTRPPLCSLNDQKSRKTPRKPDSELIESASDDLALNFAAAMAFTAPSDTQPSNPTAVSSSLKEHAALPHEEVSALNKSNSCMSQGSSFCALASKSLIFLKPYTTERRAN